MLYKAFLDIRTFCPEIPKITIGYPEIPDHQLENKCMYVSKLNLQETNDTKCFSFEELCFRERKTQKK